MILCDDDWVAGIYEEAHVCSVYLINCNNVRCQNISSSYLMFPHKNSLLWTFIIIYGIIVQVPKETLPQMNGSFLSGVVQVASCEATWFNSQGFFFHTVAVKCWLRNDVDDFTIDISLDLHSEILVCVCVIFSSMMTRINYLCHIFF